MLALSAVLSAGIGGVLGLLGGGGAILTLPMLVYGLQMESKTAIATSLFVVGVTSIAATVVHARSGTVRWRLGATFGATAMVGAFVGGRVARFVPSTVLLVAFGIVMIGTGMAMLRGRREEARASNGSGTDGAVATRVLALGGGVGLLSGLVGAGGGFLIVPALTLFGGLTMAEAVGTSLFVITLQSFAGFVGHASGVVLDWPLVLVISGAAFGGSFLGARMSRHVPAAALRRAFGGLVAAMALFVFFKELPIALAGPMALIALVGVLFASRRAEASRSARPSGKLIG